MDLGVRVIVSIAEVRGVCAASVEEAVDDLIGDASASIADSSIATKDFSKELQPDVGVRRNTLAGQENHSPGIAGEPLYRVIVGHELPVSLVVRQSEMIGQVF